MVNLLNPNLRTRDLRKLVEPHLYEVVWDLGVDETSEWVLASLEDEAHAKRLTSWLKSKSIGCEFKALLTNNAWSEVTEICWGQLTDNPERFFSQKHVLIVASDRSWVIEYAPQEIARFGRWL